MKQKTRVIRIDMDVWRHINKLGIGYGLCFATPNDVLRITFELPFDRDFVTLDTEIDKPIDEMNFPSSDETT